jgi:hypothetical protein
MKFKEFFNVRHVAIEKLLVPGMLLTDGSKFARVLFVGNKSVTVNQYRYSANGSIMKAARNTCIWFDELIESNFVPDLKDLPTQAVVNNIVFGALERREYKSYNYPKTTKEILESEEKNSKWYNCAKCDAGYPDQECTCRENSFKGVYQEVLEKHGGVFEELAESERVDSWKQKIGESVLRMSQYEKDKIKSLILEAASKILCSSDSKSDA